MARSLIVALALVSLAPFSIAVAQSATMSVSLPAGSEAERYLRALQLVGKIPSGPWAIRPFGPAEESRVKPMGAHPWMAHSSDFEPAAASWTIVPPTAAVVYNSSAPYGFNDGPVWAGKAATISASAGVAGRYSAVSLQLAPLGFLAQNAPFRLAPVSGPNVFADWVNPHLIDLPQRFGGRSYGRLDPGESRLRVDVRKLAVGFATEGQIWGPAMEQPLILGNNAGGIPHAFVGTAAPLDLRVAKVHAKVFWGRVDGSAFGSDTMNKHFATGAIISISPKLPAGLEVGAARFFHTVWGHGSLADVPWLRNFQLLFKGQLAHSASNPNGDSPDNQLASAFFRWAPPSSGFEVYGEYGREDHAGDVRDFLGEPDHSAAFVLGFQRAWLSAEADNLTVFRSEILNSRMSHLSGQAPWYEHVYIRQGHTERGQLLAAPAGYGGGAMTIALDRYTGGGRSTVRLDRALVAEARLLNDLPDAQLADVSYALRVERARFTRVGEIVNSFGIVREINRQFDRDAWNLIAGISLTALHVGNWK